jgi:hypothetical protein
VTTLVVGDLHGKFEVAKKALNTGLPVVFLGDYLDSWDRSFEDQFQTLAIVLDAAREGKAVALMGNHELSYLDETMRCSGWDQLKQTELDIFHAYNMNQYLKPYHEVDGFLLSHAGVSKALLAYYGSLSLEGYLERGYFKEIGYRRGGRKPVGGLFWCDWAEFDPIEGVKQIVGHTRGRQIREKDGNYCIDVLEDGLSTVALIDSGTIQFIEL